MESAVGDVFSGDFFGDYQEDDFDWPVNEQECAEGRWQVPHALSDLQ